MTSFRQALPKDRISVPFDTAYRTSGTVSLPTFTLNESLKRVGKIIVDKVVFPCSYFVFNNGNNSLGTINSVSIQISAGTYTAAELATAIQTTLRNTGGGFSAATCSFTNNRFVISSGSISTFTLDSTTSLAPLIGFSSNKTTVTSATSDFPIYETSFVLVSENRTFVINQSATDYTFTITPGNYSGLSLASEMQTRIALQLSNFTVSYNANNYTFTVTCNASFTFKSTGSASAALGFRNNVVSVSNSVTSPYPIDIIGPTSVIIKSRTISSARQTIVRTNTIYTDSVYEMVLNGIAGDIIYDTPEDSSEIFMATSGGATLTTIDFRLSDDTGKILDLGINGRWKIYLIFEIY